MHSPPHHSPDTEKEMKRGKTGSAPGGGRTKAEAQEEAGRSSAKARHGARLGCMDNKDAVKKRRWRANLKRKKEGIPTLLCNTCSKGCCFVT